MIKKVTSLFLVGTLWLLTISCDKTKIEAAIKASPRIAAQVDNLREQNEKSFREGLYGKETALRNTVSIGKMIEAGRIYNDAVRRVTAAYGNSPPTTEMQRLAELFDAIYVPFLDVLNTFKLLSDTQNALIKGAVSTLLEIFAIIRAGFAEVRKEIKTYVTGKSEPVTARQINTCASRAQVAYSF